MKSLLPLTLFLFCLSGAAQTADYPFAVGVHGGIAQYAGDMGNDFYQIGKHNQPFYGQIGVSVGYYLTRRLDLVGMYTGGEIGHFEGPNYGRLDGGPMRFRVRSHTVNVYVRYRFLSSDYIFRPYVFLGTGAMRYISNNADGGRGWAMNIPTAGAGVEVRLTKRLHLQVQETYMYSGTDKIDGVQLNHNDMFLFHTIGVIWQFSLERKPGVGDAIDRCTDQSKRARKVKPAQ